MKEKREERKEMDSNIRRYRPVDCGYWNDDHDGLFLYQPEMNRMKDTEFKYKNAACFRLLVLVFTSGPKQTLNTLHLLIVCQNKTC